MGKTLATLALLGTLSLSGIGCSSFNERTARETSDTLYEDAIVYAKVDPPSRHGSGAGPSIDITDEGILGVALVNVDIPKKYAIVFKCEHGKFMVWGTGSKHKELWERFNEGDSVTVSYKEIYRSTYKDTDGDGKRELINRSLVGNYLLDAQLKHKN